MSAAIWNDPGEPPAAHPGLGPITVDPDALPARTTYTATAPPAPTHAMTLTAYNVGADGTRYVDAQLVAMGLAKAPAEQPEP